MAYCAARTAAHVSKGNRVCPEAPKFSGCGACADNRGVYRGTACLEPQDRTWFGDLVRTSWKQVEPYSRRLLVCVCEPPAFSIHPAALVHAAFDLVSISVASESR